MNRWKRVSNRDTRLWAAAGLAVSGFLVMREISGLLGQLESGARSFTMNTLTRPRLTPWDTQPLRDAVQLWHEAEAGAAVGTLLPAHEWVTYHAGIDVVFTVAYSYLLFRLLCAVRVPALRARVLALTVLATDEVENALTLALPHYIGDSALALNDPPGLLLAALGVATLVKWAVLAATLTLAAIAILDLFATKHPDGVTPDDDPGRAQKYLSSTKAAAAAGGRARLLSRFQVQIAALIFLTVFVVAPGGGPIEQLSDVLRASFDGTWADVARRFWPNLLALGLLVASIYVTGRWTTLLDQPPAEGDQDLLRRPAVAPWIPLLLGVLGTVAAVIVMNTELGTSAVTWGVAAVPVLLLVLTAVTWLAGRSPFQRRAWPEPGVDGAPEISDAVYRLDVPAQEKREAIRRLLHRLTALPLFIAALGLVKAFARPMVLSPQTSATWLLLLGVVLAVISVPLTVLVIARLESWKGRRLGRARRLVTGLLTAVVAVAAIDLAVDPIGAGDFWQLNGVVVIFLAAVLLVFGGLRRLSEQTLPGWATFRLSGRLVRRTPVVTGVLAVFLLSGALNTTGGYHDVRLTGDGQALSELGAGSGAPATSATTSEPVRAWWDAWTPLVGASGCSNTLPAGSTATDAPSRPVMPLILVAAAGGGIRAAYWSASTLDEVIDAPASLAGRPEAVRLHRRECARLSLFSLSGVSGGAVGLSTWMVQPDSGPIDPANDAAAAVGRLAEPTPLSADAAALLFRDPPAALTGINFGWDDRAGVLERAWEAKVPALANDVSTVIARGTGSWNPLLLLNSTSTEDGCRVLVSESDLTLGGAADRDCRSIPPAPGGPAVAAKNALSFTIDRGTLQDRKCTDSTRLRSMSLSTAAHLSARFAYVSPSGEMLACAELPTQGEPIATYAIDGGYLENSGVQSLLQVWSALQPLVAQWNSTPDPVRNPGNVLVVPLIVMSDNHYQSVAAVPPPRRRAQLLVPLKGKDAPNTPQSSQVMEQLAHEEFSGAPPGMNTDLCAAGGESAAPAATQDLLCRRAFRIAPDVRPQVSAPLGWTLSQLSKDNLDTQMKLQFPDGTCPRGESLKGGCELRELLQRLLSAG